MTPPDPKPKPALAQWLFDRSMSYADGARLFDCSLEKVRLLCLPVEDARRQNPGLELAQVIQDKTDGAIGLDDWPPLTGPGRRRRADAEAAA